MLPGVDLDELDRDERAATAYHEAGHAVIVEALGLQLECLSIKPSPESTEAHQGYTRFSDPNGEQQQGNAEQLRSRVVFSFAGYAAENRFTGRQPVIEGFYGWPGAARDEDEARKYFAHYLGVKGPEWVPDIEWEAYRRRLWDETERLVEMYWPRICAVARALLLRGSWCGSLDQLLIDCGL
jgi:hypothetical protein